MAKVTANDVKVGVSVARGILGFLTDIKAKLPKWMHSPLQYGRDRGWWQKGQGPSDFGGGIHR